jgi:hypothetical protein
MYTLTTLKLALGDMFGKRIDDIRKTKAGNYFEPMLKEHLSAIEGLPAVLTGEAPLARELAALDKKHDGYGALILFTMEACFRDPDIDPDLLAAARRIRKAFISELGELQDSYAVQADRARDRKPLLDSMKADLSRFPVAGAQARTLLDVATSFIDQGEQIHKTLSDRADIMQQTRKAVASIRSSAIGTLNRFRADVVRERDRDANLPQDIEQRIFGYLDTLQSMEPASAKPAPAPEK